MFSKAAIPRVTRRALVGALILLSAGQAAAQEVLFIECRLTTGWQGNEGRGNWGTNFIARANADGIATWQAEQRQWRGILNCDAGNELARSGIPEACTANITDGEAVYVRRSTWNAGEGVSRLRISRVTGMYAYEGTMNGTRDWFEEGICSPTENPETQATTRVF